MANPKHLRTFATTDEFVTAYNSGSFSVPYVAVIASIREANGEPRVLYSNRLPHKEGVIAAPAKLAANGTLGQMVLGASRLGK